MKILLRGSTSDALTAQNPILSSREPCVETDTQKIKLGDGVSRWNDLPYVGDGGVVTSVEGFNVVATMDIPGFSAVTTSGKVGDSSNLAFFSKVVGIATADILNGFSGLVRNTGSLINPGWSWSTGDIVYLNGTSLSSSAPSTGFIQRLGVAKGPTNIVLELGEPVLL